MRGTVRSFSPINGYGFIKGQNGHEYFVHWSFIKMGGYKTLEPGQRVEFTRKRVGSRWQAHEVRVVRASHLPAPTVAPAPIAIAVPPVIARPEPHQVASEALAPAATRIRRNPFDPFGPVVRPSLFSGRHNALRTSVHTLHTSGNVLVTGGRGVGKTSLAKQLVQACRNNQEVLTRLGLEDDGAFAHFKVIEHICTPGQGVTDVAEQLALQLAPNGDWRDLSRTAKLLMRIFGSIGGSMVWGKRKRVLADVLANPKEFAHYLQAAALGDPRTRLAIVIDEIENLTGDGEATSRNHDGNERTDPGMTNVGAFARAVGEALGEDRRVAFVLVGVNAAVLKMEREHPSSFRPFTRVPLEKMADDELSAILRVRLEEHGYSIDQEVAERIVQLAAGYPHTVQYLGFHCFNADTDGTIGRDDFDHALAHVVQELKNHEFRVLYDMAEPEIRSVFLALTKSPTSQTASEVAERVSISVQKATAVLSKLKDDGKVIYDENERSYRLADPILAVYVKWLELGDKTDLFAPAPANR